MTSQTFCPRFTFRRCQDPVGMQPLFPGFSKEGGKGRLVKEETCVTEFLRVESRTVAAGMIVILVTIVLTVSHGHWRFFRLNWSNPLQISPGDDRQATFEGQSSQPENSGDTLTQIRVEGPSGNYKPPSLWKVLFTTFLSLWTRSFNVWIHAFKELAIMIMQS
ncbi:uncharacterized protein [Acropora muricata]|uniref:uncharacterized protein isoform X5 n=1 Tax=Acropora muricata TaxID=159855 RepID=UPI0034E47086